jgi:hypothetical protein
LTGNKSDTQSFSLLLTSIYFEKLTIDLWKKSIFAPLTPQVWGEPEFKVPQCKGDLGGIPGFMQEV